MTKGIAGFGCLGLGAHMHTLGLQTVLPCVQSSTSLKTFMVFSLTDQQFFNIKTEASPKEGLESICGSPSFVHAPCVQGVSTI